MLTIFLYFCAQNGISAAEISKLPFEDYQENIYELIMDPLYEESERSELIAYATFFDGPLAIQKLYPLLKRKGPVSVKNSILRYWSCCLQDSDEKLFYLIFDDLPEESLFLCVKNLIDLSQNGDSYIRIFERVSKRDLDLAAKSLQYMPIIANPASFPDFLSTLLFSHNDLIRQGAQSKLSQYFYGDDIFRFYLISTATGFPREEWLPLLARLNHHEANQESLEWLLSEEIGDKDAKLCRVVAKALVGKNVTVDKLREIELSKYIDDNSKFEIISATKPKYLIEHFDEAPLFWQKQALLGLSKKNKSLALAVLQNPESNQALRNQACKSLILIGEDWRPILRGAKSEEEAIFALRTAFKKGAAIEDLFAEAKLHSSKNLLIFELHHLLASSDDKDENLLAMDFLENLFFAAQSEEKKLFELSNVREIKGQIPEIDSLTRALPFTPSLMFAHSKSKKNGKDLWLLSKNLTLNGACIIMALLPYLVEKVPETSRVLLSSSLEILKPYPRWYAYSLALAANYFYRLEIGRHALSQLISQHDLLKFEFQIREAFSPEGREWEVLEDGLKDLKVFSDGVVSQDISLLEKLLDGNPSPSILQSALEYLMTLEGEQRYDVLELSFQLAKKAVDNAPFSLKSHNQLVAIGQQVNLDSQKLQVFEDRLNRLKTFFQYE